MDSTPPKRIFVERPPGVWIICVGSLLLYLVYAVVALLYFSQSAFLPFKWAHGLQQLTWTWWTGAAALEMLGLGATWTLFQMRTAAVRWGGASLIYTTVSEIYNLVTGGAGMLLRHPGSSIGPVVGDTIEAMIYAYTLRLRADGMLHGPMPAPDRLRSPPSQPTAFAAGVAISLGGALCITGALFSYIALHFSAGRGATYPLMLGGAAAVLAVSGFALWRKWRGAGPLNAFGAAAVGLVWGANWLYALLALAISLACLRLSGWMHNVPAERAHDTT